MSKQCISDLNDDGVLLCGYYKKLKTMKKKFFVLYNDTARKVARIEYYDNEKKYKSGFTPKRIIKIKSCFNINRRLYTKHDFVIVLSSKEGGFGIVMDSEDEMNTWLNHLLHLQRSGETSFDFPKFDYVWQVIIQKKGAAEQHNIFGSHHICLTNKSVTFIKIGREKNVAEKKISKVEVLLTTIRRCGDSQCFFYMEIGRQSSLGPGELWMETEDSLTAQNMHKMILSKMVSLNEAIVEPMRKRSSSATESTNLHQERKSSQNCDIANSYFFGAQQCCRDRCDSLPSRNRTSSESSNRITRHNPNTLSSRLLNFNVSNASPIVYSASEDSVSIEDYEESMGISHFIRFPDGVAFEEYIQGVSKIQNFKEKNDPSSLVTSSLAPIFKANLPITKQCCATKYSDTKRGIGGNINDQLNFSMVNHSLGSKCDDITKEESTNRVRAFSVGSRIRSNRINSKAGPKFCNSNSVDCSTRKSISVPVLINKNLQTTDQMSDLMEIDFSKSVGKTLCRNFHYDGNECKNTTFMRPRILTFSNSEESIQNSLKKTDGGYLEMKPITLDSYNIICNGNICINNTNFISQNQHSSEIESVMCANTVDDTNSTFSQKITNCALLNNVNSSPSEDANLTCNENHYEYITSDKLEGTDVNKDLYYASLDLPKCSDEVNSRYSFQENLTDTNIEEMKNEYAKINFVKPDTSRKSTKKNIKL